MASSDYGGLCVSLSTQPASLQQLVGNQSANAFYWPAAYDYVGNSIRLEVLLDLIPQIVVANKLHEVFELLNRCLG